ncbi:MAG: hypothetical protein K2M64_03435, partial [Clostridia bacterium]|nr:hypothetical protein [Clostridia bacterium]
MNIGSYQLTIEEERLVENIYTKFQSEFEQCKYVHRKEILGIGEQGRYLMCYFFLKNGLLLVKFKSEQNASQLLCDTTLSSKILQTIELFKNNAFITQHQTNAYISANSQYQGCTEEVIA